MKQQLQLEFKTNELIITDWISLKEFDAQVGSIHLLSQPNGTTLSTLEAAQHGFIRIHTSDLTSSIHRKDDNFSFGLATNKKNYSNIGDVHLGVWAVTIIEKQKLIDIVSNKIESQQAEKLVANYLNTKTHTIVHIEPGNYTLSFDPNVKQANEIFSLKKDKVIKINKLKM